MIRKLIPVIVITLLLSSCGNYQKLLKSTDNEVKYETAIKYFEEKDYYRAIQLFDQLQPFYRGTDKAEKIAFYYAYAHYEQRDYILASYYFKQFAANYPNSRNAEEAAYLSAYCNYLDSPPSSLDQNVTLDAIKGLQLFIDQYPGSSRVQNANELIDELRQKLEAKVYDIADLYLRMEDYKAAIIGFKNLLKEYPDTRYREIAMFNVARASYFYAEKSTATKQQERYQAASDALDNFLASYPESTYRKEVLQLKKNTDRQLQGLLTIQ